MLRQEIEENKKNETAKQKKLSDTLNFYENLYINEKQIVSLILKNEVFLLKIKDLMDFNLEIMGKLLF